MNDPIKCLIVDDEPLAIKIMTKHVSEMPRLSLVGTCSNALDAFEILKTTPVDLIFLDINMPVLTGIEFVKSLQQAPHIIFTTAYRNYAVESYELNVIDYLLKPISFSRFLKAIDKLLDTPQTSAPASKLKEESHEKEYLYVNENKKYVKVVFEEVLYIESLKDYIRIHTQEKPIVTKEKISEFYSKLPKQFLRIHRSFIVNLPKVTAFTTLNIEVKEKLLPIGSSYQKEVLTFLKLL